MDVVKEDMAEVEVTKEDTEVRKHLEKENPLWRPLMGKAERRRRRNEIFAFTDRSFKKSTHKNSKFCNIALAYLSGRRHYCPLASHVIRVVLAVILSWRLYYAFLSIDKDALSRACCMSKYKDHH